MTPSTEEVGYSGLETLQLIVWGLFTRKCFPGGFGCPFPDLPAPGTGSCRAQNHRSFSERCGDPALLNSSLVAGELVGFGPHDQSGYPRFVQPIGKLDVPVGRLPPGIDQLDNQGYHRTVCKILVDKLFPLTAFRFWYAGVAVTRQIHKKPSSFDPEKIYRPGFSGSRARPGQISEAS